MAQTATKQKIDKEILDEAAKSLEIGLEELTQYARSLPFCLRVTPVTVRPKLALWWVDGSVGLFIRVARTLVKERIHAIYQDPQSGLYAFRSFRQATDEDFDAIASVVE